MTEAVARKIVERVEDADSNGDPSCRDCGGDGSRHVPEVCAYARCSCRDRIDEAYETLPHRTVAALEAT